MSRLWIGNLPVDATDADITAMLEQYGFPPHTGITRVDAESERPGAVVHYDGIEASSLRKYQERIAHLYWREHTLNVQVTGPLGT